MSRQGKLASVNHNVTPDILSVEGKEHFPSIILCNANHAPSFTDQTLLDSSLNNPHPFFSPVDSAVIFHHLLTSFTAQVEVKGLR